MVILMATAFSGFQKCLHSADESNYVDSDNNWDMREILMIPAGQFKHFIVTGNALSKPNFHALRITHYALRITHYALRIAISALHHGECQLRSPDRLD